MSADVKAGTVERALQLASGGWYVFPARAKDQPLVKAWQHSATTDPDTIRYWWEQWPNALVCIVPGRSGHAVIDIDVHPDQPSGFDSAILASAPVTAQVSNLSTSGNGLHLWYQGLNRTCQQVNGMRSIDCRSVGGYVVTHADYELPPAAEVTQPIPEKYRVAPTEAASSTGVGVEEWRGAMDPGSASEELKAVARAVGETGVGYGDMLAATSELARLARTTGDLEQIELARARYALGYRPKYRKAWDAALAGSVDYFGVPNTVTRARKEFGVTELERSEHAEPEAVSETAPDARERAILAELERIEVREEAQQRHRLAQSPPEPIPSGASLRDFLAVADPPVAYRVEEVAPVGGNVLVVAPAKVGKSTLVGNLAHSLADGTDFLGRFKVNGSPTVGIIDIELDERTLRRWLREQGIANLDAVRVYGLRGRVASFDLTNERRLAEWAEELRGIDFLIADPLRPILDALGLDEWRDAGRFLVNFDALKLAAGVGETLVSHHTGHAGERSRGDSRIVDWADAVWTMTREKVDDPLSARYFKAHGRDVELAEERLEFNPFTRALSLVPGTRSSGAARAVEQVVAHIAASATPLSQRAVESWFTGSIKRDDVRDALRIAVDGGQLSRTVGAHRSLCYELTEAEKSRRSSARGATGAGRAES